MMGHFLLVLHAHLPFVRHPEDEYFLEEDWLYEAITETYLPLLQLLFRLFDEGVPFRLTISLSPTLLSMLEDALLMQRYQRRLDALIELAEREVSRSRTYPENSNVSRFYLDRLRALKSFYEETLRRDLVSAFNRLHLGGYVELITTSATHAYLPLWQEIPSAIDVQVQAATAYFQATFKRAPRGFWLPECGFFPTLDSVLSKQNLHFFFLDSHGVRNATPPPTRGLSAPVLTPLGVAAFGRDEDSSEQVWSARRGFPGHVNYREFHRDIGYERAIEHLEPFVPPKGLRRLTGLKFHRITGATEDKEIYEPEAAKRQAQRDAQSFFRSKMEQFQRWKVTGLSWEPMVLAPYDAELFGHWWFEGPWFLEEFIRLCARGNEFRLSTPWECLSEQGALESCQPAFSSWGQGGFSEMWLDDSNQWIYAPLLNATERMVKRASEAANYNILEQRALHQAARELLLAQSSDWPFLMKVGTARAYATRRLTEHLENASLLLAQVENRTVAVETLNALEQRNNLFPHLDFRMFASKKTEAL